MSMFRKTWNDDYSGGRLVSLKYHCNGKPHVKALLSLKASVLMPDKVGQIIVDMSVSPDEFRQLKRKADISYFAAKNVMSAKKLSNLVDIVTRNRNLGFEKDFESLYINKDGC